MTNIGKQITDLLMDTGKSAPDMTHALKDLGNGSMQKGFARIAEFFKEEIATATAKELTKGRIQGSIIGILGTVTFGSFVALAINNQKKKAAHKVEGEEILKSMKSNIPTPQTDANNLDDTDIIDNMLSESSASVK